MKDAAHPPNQIVPVICGPTASGKTSLAVSLARFCRDSGCPTEIISADSRQVYRGMDLGTGKDIEEYGSGPEAIPAWCLDVADPSQIFTLFDFQNEAYRAVDEIRAKGSLPMICGGTGLYIEAVLKGYRIANVPEDVELRNSLMKEPKEQLDAALEQADPQLHKNTDRSSKKRIVRALEIAEAAKRGPVRWSGENRPEMEPVILITRWPTDELNRRIDIRLQQRLELGMIDEVQQLIDNGITLDRLELFGMEYGHIGRHLFGHCSREEMVSDLNIAIHRLAKRQRTWFRGMERRGFSVHWIDRAEEQQAMQILSDYNLSVSL